jgi:hydroxyacyl-ACP dehydratase HTD2-like protein with hotdog domain
MAGGSKYEVFGRVRVGDVLTVTERLQRIVEKPGTQGPLVFVTTESSYRNQVGEMVARYEQTVIFR